MTSMVEKMARAMEAEAIATALTTGPSTFADTHALTMRMALAALIAMREPTEAMLKPYHGLNRMRDTQNRASYIYASMIEAAILEQKQ